MNDQWFLITSAALSVFVVVGIGATSRQLGWLSEEADQSLLKLILRILVPCLVFTSVVDNPSLKNPNNLIWPPVVGSLSLLIGFGVTVLAAKVAKGWLGLENYQQRRTFAFSTGVFNYGFIPIPLVALLFDNETLGVLFVHNLGVELTFWTAGILVISDSLEKGWWKHMVNPVSLTLVTSVILNYLNAIEYVPMFLLTPIQWLGRAAVPISILLIGAIAADQFQLRNKSQNILSSFKTIVGACALRLGIVPILMLSIGLILPISIELKRVIIIQAAMPAAIFSIIMARLYHGCPGTALRIALGTSIVSLLTIPLWISFGMTLFKLARP